MYRHNLELILLSAIISTCCSASNDVIHTDLVISKVARSIDLTTHLPKVSSTITLENTGKSSVRSFLFAIDPDLSDHVSYIGAVYKSADGEKKLTVRETTVSGHTGKKFYRIDLDKSLDGGQQTTVDVEAAFSHTLQPYPALIPQSEKQLMRFISNLYFYSPYATTSQTTIINCATSNIESYTKTNPVKVSESAITYGPFESKDPFSQGDLTVHFENNTPFLAITHLTRLIEVSHWGNIAIEETVDIRHYGATLKGPFSRYDYQRNQDGASSVKSFKTVLPAAARDVYYRDEIGNISTSHLREMDDMVEVELRPRFPLFGGWKTHYVLGYNVPSYQYIFNSGDQYKLKMRFVDHIYDDQVIDEMTLRVILPEGSSNIDLQTPFVVAREPNELHYTYLDTLGRPVIIAHKSNLVEQHIQDFELNYTFKKFLLLQEPLLVVSAFYLLFIVMIIYVRLDFSITKDEASESRMRVASLIEQIQGVQDCRSALYQSYDDAINKYKAGKDANVFNTNRKKIDADYKQLTQQINSLLAKLKAEGSEVAEKVNELQRLDKDMREQIGLCITYAEKLIANKMTKSQYVDMEGTIKHKRDDFYQKMETLLTTL